MATISRLDVSALLFPATYRRRVLALLLLHPGRALHVREIARLTATTAGTLNKELARLHAAGLLDRERVGNQPRYPANISHPVFPELAGVLRKTVGVANVLIDALAPLGHRIDLAFVFGSMAHGTATAGSDVDLLVVGGVDFGTVVDALQGAQLLLSREINPKVYAPRDWKAKLASRDPFARQIAAQPRILLIGGDRELAQPRRRKP